MNSKLAIGLGAAAIVACGLAIYLGQDEDEIQVVYDKNIHTREELIKLLKEFDLEYTSLLLHWYKMLRDKK